MQEDNVWHKALDSVTEALRQEIAESASIAAAGTAAVLSELRAVRRAIDAKQQESTSHASASVHTIQPSMQRLGHSTPPNKTSLLVRDGQLDQAPSAITITASQRVESAEATPSPGLSAESQSPTEVSAPSQAKERSPSASVSWGDVRRASAANVLVCEVESSRARRSFAGAGHTSRKKPSLKASGQVARSIGLRGKSIEASQSGDHQTYAGLGCINGRSIDMTKFSHQVTATGACERPSAPASSDKESTATLGTQPIHFRRPLPSVPTAGDAQDGTTVDLYGSALRSKNRRKTANGAEFVAQPPGAKE